MRRWVAPAHAHQVSGHMVCSQPAVLVSRGVCQHLRVFLFPFHPRDVIGRGHYRWVLGRCDLSRRSSVLSCTTGLDRPPDCHAPPRSMDRPFKLVPSAADGPLFVRPCLCAQASTPSFTRHRLQPTAGPGNPWSPPPPPPFGCAGHRDALDHGPQRRRSQGMAWRYLARTHPPPPPPTGAAGDST